MPVLIHEPEITEAAVFIYHRVVFLEQLRGMVELPQIQALSNLDDLVHAKAIRRECPQFRPAVVDMVFIYCVVSRGSST
jgi:hypothetical protein